MQSSYIIDINESNVTELLQNAQSTPILFYFWSDRSQHCKEMTPILERIAHEQAGHFILAKVDCDKEQMIASQFGIRSIPMGYIFKDGQPVDGFQGIQTEAQLRELLNKVLPKEEDLLLAQAQQLIAEQQYELAAEALHNAWRLDEKRSDIALPLAQCFVQLKRTEDAQSVLDKIPPQDRDSVYQQTLAQIELLKQAADTPEIQHLQSELAKAPENYDVMIQLAGQLHQVGRNEEALELLFAPLKHDLNTEDGKVKKALLDILSALGTQHPLAAQYRRQLYSLLY